MAVAELYTITQIMEIVKLSNLAKRILSTLHFFDLQDYPLTLLELHKFLIADADKIKSAVNVDWEYIGSSQEPETVDIGLVLNCLNNECRPQTASLYGFYCLKGREQIIKLRWENYLYGIFREKRIKKFISSLRFLPFVWGVALTGSQAMGQEKSDSDIDLLVIADPKFLWLTRTLVTAYFQVLGLRRHGKYVTNRFCLNHYLAGVKEIQEFRNLYTACEYAKLRPLIYSQAIAGFQEKNISWIKSFLPNFEPLAAVGERQSKIQSFMETALGGSFGQWLEIKLKSWQLPKIRQEEFILVKEDELSFHPQSKQRDLLARFFAG